MSYSDSTYFAAKEAKDVASVVLKRAETFYNHQYTNGWLDKLRSSYNAYHGAYYDSVISSHTISFGGEQGELVNFPVNHYRNIGQHLLTMTTSSRPAMQAKAINTDSKSIIQTVLANSLLDYYMREKDLERRIKRAVEMAIVLGAGYIKLEWDAKSGEVYEYDSKPLLDENGAPVLDENGNPKEVDDPDKPIYEGDVKFTNMSPFDVVFDTYKEDNVHDWVICRTFKNKYDLAAKYPELRDKIVQLQTKSDQLSFKFSQGFVSEETDDVPVYEFFHRKSEALPSGRYLVFLAEDIILHDVAMPYRDLPIIRVAPSEVMGTPYGYTPMFDLLPVQEAINSTYSSIMTNQNAFAVQNVVIPKNSDITVNQLEGGLNLIECNMQLGIPQALNLTQTPPEVFSFLDRLIKEMETLSGVNSVARGNPTGDLKSGTALALVQALALQFSSTLQAEYIKSIEAAGSMLIKMLQDFAVAKRTITIISGINNETEVKEFSQDDLSSISRVVVEVSNPMSRTTSGKIQMAEQMLQYGMLKEPSQYISVVNTGNLETVTEDPQTQYILMKKENERMIKGDSVVVLATDMHMQHINTHRSILDDYELRMNPELVQAVTQHIMEHYQQLQQVDPQFLMTIGQQPIQPATPAQGSPADMMQNPQEPPAVPELTEQSMGGLPPSVTGPGLESPVRIPNPAKPPGEFANMPVLTSQQ